MDLRAIVAEPEHWAAGVIANVENPGVSIRVEGDDIVAAPNVGGGPGVVAIPEQHVGRSKSHDTLVVFDGVAFDRTGAVCAGGGAGQEEEAGPGVSALREVWV